MKSRITFALAGWLALGAVVLAAQTAPLAVPSRVTAGSSFSVPTSGSGKATFYLVGPGQALRRALQLGDTISIAAGEVPNAGHYTVLLVGPSGTQAAELDVTAAAEPATLSFLAKPSRLPVNLPDAISGVVYVFDAFGNLVLDPKQVTFELSVSGGATQTQSISTHNGVAWLKLHSAPKAGAAQFQARIDNLTAKRVVQQVSGDPCNLRMSARKSGGRIELETQPLLDCSGNAVPDGTIVTFKESSNGTETTVDVPIKRGVARTTVPDYQNGVISVATGVVMGNEIRLGGGL
jgi:hypothetical protein